MRRVIGFLSLCVGLGLCAPAFSADNEVETKINELAGKMIGTYSKLPKKEKVSRIAVVSFTNIGSMSEQKKMGQIVAELLQANFTKGKAFEVVERERLDKILQEMKLSAVGLTEPGNAEKFGKLMDAQAIITGSVADVGDKFAVNARMIDVEKGKIILSEDVKLQQANMIALSEKYIVRRNKSDAMFRSMAVPGWGQVYNNQKVKGYLITGASGALVIGAVANYMIGSSQYSKYKNGTPEDVGYYDKAKKSYQTGDTLLYVFVGVWAIAAVDGYLNGPDEEKIEVPARAASSGPGKSDGKISKTLSVGLNGFGIRF